MRSFFMTLLFTLSWTTLAWSHCQVPCGIYGDHGRFEGLKESVDTIQKAMEEVKKLAKTEGDPLKLQQFVRWINTKESHAQQIQEIMADYFLAQRIKPAEGDNPKTKDRYQKSLHLIHQIIVEAMKCKQTVDKKHVEKLRNLIEAFEAHYFSQ